MTGASQYGRVPAAPCLSSALSIEALLSVVPPAESAGVGALGDVWPRWRHGWL
jgi:hypothetical protein